MVYDWAHILWDDQDDENKSIPVLGQIHMFVDCRTRRYDSVRYVYGIELIGWEYMP